MVSIIYLICVMLVSIVAGTFTSFIISKLWKTDTKTDSIQKRCWSMGIYMDDIPQTEQNTLHLSSVPLKIYNWGEYSELPVPHKGEEIRDVYYSGDNKFEMTGIVENVFYNIAMDWLVVRCRCIDIQNLK